MVSIKSTKFINAMEIQRTYTTLEQLTAALLCSNAFASGWFHVMQTGYPFFYHNPPFAFLFLGSRMSVIPEDVAR